MFVRILGALQIEEGGRRIVIGGIRQRAVFADLLLSASDVVPAERLLVDLWGEDSAPSAANALQAAVSRLRRVLPPGRLVTRTPGYALRILPAETDASRAERLLSEGRTALAAGAAADAARALREALSLWRGPALADFRYEPFAQAEIARLEELHLTCLEERIEADLALGLAQDGPLIAELQRLAGLHPVRERLRGQLMVALYRAGRQTEALQAYRECQRMLADELGLETSPFLQNLEMAILRHDRALSLPASATAAEAPFARGPVSVLCVVLRAVSSTGAALDPEAQEIVTQRAISALTAVLERHGGKLTVTEGERLMGVFGVASVHEDDALRAARASLQARVTLDGETAVLLRRHSVCLTCRFGLATGEALLGGSGPLGFAGDTGAEAALLAEAADPGQIVISRQAHELAAAAIEADYAGPDRFLLRGARAARPVAVCLDAPLVNRDQERELVEAAYARAAREQATVLVTLTGEAGCGKTRLVHEVASRLGNAASTLTGRCVPYGEGITFWPLREIVRQASGGQDSPDKIEALLRGEADATAVAEQLSRALGTSQEGSSDTAEIFWAASRLLETLAQSRPLVVIFEDLHWAEPTFLDLVESLAFQGRRSALLCICIARPELLELRPSWATGTGRAVSIELEPLARDAAEALLDALAIDQEISPYTRTRILETACGNPLYLEQLTAALSEQRSSGVRPSLPPTIQALLAARLRRLGPGASMVLARAAIIGKDFSVSAVRELLPPDARGPLAGNIQTLIAKGLVQRGSRTGGCCFRHMVIQQAAYRAIPKALRAELHHRFADWLEHADSEQTPQRAEIAGYHLEQAVHYLRELRPAEVHSSDLPLRAATHLETAGQAAHDRGDALAAVNLLDRAVALLPAEDPALARLCTGLGTALAEAGQLHQARVMLDRAQGAAAACQDEGQRARAQVQALMLSLRMDPNGAAPDIACALPSLERGFDQSRDGLGLCLTMRLHAALHWIHGTSAAAEDAWRRAAGFARLVNDRRQLIEILGWLASAALWGPTPAREGIRRCDGYLAEAGNHPSGQAVILHHMAGLHAMQDDTGTARTMLGRAKELLDTLGPTMNAVLTEPAAFVAMLVGDPETAESHLRLQYESLSRMGDKAFLSTTAALLARAIMAQGPSRYEEAARLIAISNTAGAGEDLSAQIIGQGLEARLLAYRGRHAEAEKLAHQAVAAAARTDLLSDRADAALGLARVLAVAGCDADAHAAAIQARDLYRSKGNLPGLRESLRFLANSAPV